MLGCSMRQRPKSPERLGVTPISLLGHQVELG